MFSGPKTKFEMTCVLWCSLHQRKPLDDICCRPLKQPQNERPTAILKQNQYCEETNYDRTNSKTITNGKDNGNLRRINSNKLTDGNGNSITPWHKTVRLDFRPTTHRSHVCRNLNPTHPTYPTFGCVFQRKSFRKSYALPQVSDHDDSRKSVLLRFQCNESMTAFGATTLKNPTFSCIFSAMTITNHMLCSVFKHNDV